MRIRENEGKELALSNDPKNKSESSSGEMLEEVYGPI